MRTKRKPQSVYQYEPLVTPSNWSGEEKQFVVRLTQLFDQLFARKTGPSGAVEPGTPGEPGKDGEDGVGIASVVQTTTSTADGGENIVTVTLTDGSSNRFSVRNGSKGSTGSAGVAGQDGAPGKNGVDGKDGSDGYTPVRGVDYWTDADKTEIINAVLAAIGGGGTGETLPPDGYLYIRGDEVTDWTGGWNISGTGKKEATYIYLGADENAQYNNADHKVYTANLVPMKNISTIEAHFVKFDTSTSVGYCELRVVNANGGLIESAKRVYPGASDFTLSVDVSSITSGCRIEIATGHTAGSNRWAYATVDWVKCYE